MGSVGLERSDNIRDTTACLNRLIVGKDGALRGRKRTERGVDDVPRQKEEVN